MCVCFLGPGYAGLKVVDITEPAALGCLCSLFQEVFRYNPGVVQESHGCLTKPDTTSELCGTSHLKKNSFVSAFVFTLQKLEIKERDLKS